MTAPDHTLKPFKKPLAPTGASIHAQIRCRPKFPFSWTDLSHGFSDGYAERSEAVQDGDTDLELGDLTVEIPSCQSLAQQFDAMHLGFDAAPSVIAAPSSPDRPTEAF